uniref:Rhombotin-1 n=1 Tax=Cacopsylla melanoneura TaxID=428564 RepID=A0A8D8M723_9HEMI
MVENSNRNNSLNRMSMDAAKVQGAQQSKPNPNSAPQAPQECAGCGKHITERFLLKALDMFWHEDCLKCGCCDCRLGEVGSTLYTKANLILCKRDYLRLFGSTGYCAACSKVIPAFEMVMRARNNVYHLECFACQQCNHRFCVGDRFYLCENKILCEYDYEERMVFANMAYNPNTIAQLKRHATHLPPAGRSNGQMGGVAPPSNMTNGGDHSMTTNGHHHFSNQGESNMMYDVK